MSSEFWCCSCWMVVINIRSCSTLLAFSSLTLRLISSSRLSCEMCSSAKSFCMHRLWRSMSFSVRMLSLLPVPLQLSRSSLGESTYFLYVSESASLSPVGPTRTDNERALFVAFLPVSSSDAPDESDSDLVMSGSFDPAIARPALAGLYSWSTHSNPLLTQRAQGLVSPQAA